MSSEQRHYVVQRPDGVRSKKWSRSRIIQMFEAGKIPVSSVVISDSGKKTDIELFAFLPSDDEPVTRRKPSRPSAKPKPPEPNPTPLPRQLRRIVPPVPEATNTAIESKIAGDGLSADVVLRFITGLPHRDVAVILPTGQFTWPFGAILAAVQSCPPNEIVLDGSGRLAICELKKKKGWLAVTFLPTYLLAVKHLEKSPAELPPASILQQLYILSNRFLSANDAGLQCSDLRTLVTQFLEISNTHRHFGSPSRWARVFVDDPVLDLKDALREWSKDPGFIATRFMGGGFGFKAAVEGMLIASALNMFVDSINAATARVWQQKLSQPLHMGANKLYVTREMAAFYLRNG